MEKGISVDCWGGRGEAWIRAQRLHEKMNINLSMARDRLHFLGKLSLKLNLIIILRIILSDCLYGLDLVNSNIILFLNIYIKIKSNVINKQSS